MTSVNTVTQCREDWSSASVFNHTIVTDPTIRQPGFHLPRHTWSPMNRSGQVKAHVVLSCTNGVSRNQHHEIVASATDHEPYCQHALIKKIEGGLNLLHEADDDAVIWLESAATAALANNKEIICNS